MIISRFAPSPSYYPHLGHLRGLLILKHLTARGKLYLRLDDTGEEEYLSQYVREFLDLFRRYQIPLAGVIRASKRSASYISEIKRLLVSKRAFICECPDTVDKKYRVSCYCHKKNLEWKDMSPERVVRLRSDHEADYVILRYNKRHRKYTPTLTFQSVVDDKFLGVNYLYRGSDLESSESRLREIYSITSGNNRFPVSKYWGRIAVIDGQTSYEVSKSAKKSPHEIPGIRALERDHSREAIEQFLLSYGKTKSPIRVDLRKLRSISKRLN